MAECDEDYEHEQKLDLELGNEQDHESMRSRSKRFFASTVKSFFLFTGAGTALVALYAFFPQWAVPNVGRLPFRQDHTIIVQHWGIMVGLMGVFMMAAAMIPRWRLPIFAYSGVEKAFMVWLVLTNANTSYVKGFWVPFALDSMVVLYTIGYFLAFGFRGTEEDAPGVKLQLPNNGAA